MSKDLYKTNDKNLDFNRNEDASDECIYLNNRLVYLEKIIQAKYSDMLYLASQISTVKNMSLKHDLVDILVEHGSNLSRYKSELKDIKNMLNALVENTKNENNIGEKSIKDNENDIEDIKPHNTQSKDTVSTNGSKVTFETTGQDYVNEKPIIDHFNDEPIIKDSRNKLSKGLNFKKLKVVEAPAEPQKDKNEIAREKILKNLDKLISYKENTFNDLIEMVDFHINSNSEKVDLTKFIENLESQIVELNEYKNNILKNYSLSKSIELGSNGRITFSRVFIEKERLIDKNKHEYISTVNEMYDLYSEFVDSYLKNINHMKPHLNPDKINSMQNNCAKVIYDFKLIKNLYSSLDKIK